MARSISDIQQSIVTSYVNNMAAIGFTVNPNAWSSTNLIRLATYVFAAAAFVLETLFDLHRTDVNNDLAEKQPHTLRFYRNQALAFQYGFALGEDGKYDNTGYTDEQIAASKIVKYAAVIEQPKTDGRLVLRIKLAGSNGSDLQQLTTEQVSAVKEYFSRVIDAGVERDIESNPPDSLIQEWNIYYDPLVLNANGSRLDGTDSDPVGKAIRNYLTALPFNGVYVLAYAVDAVQAVDGVVIPEIVSAMAKYGNLNYTPINTKYTPDAGWLRFLSPTDLKLNFIAQSVIK